MENAPANAKYVTMELNPTLTNERVVQAGPGMSITDEGADRHVVFTSFLPYVEDTSLEANTFTVELDPAPESYYTGLAFGMKAANAVTGPSTISVSVLGRKSLKKTNGLDIAAGDIVADQVVVVLYDGTNFLLLSQSAVSPTPAPHAATHAAAGSDPVNHNTLANLQGGGIGDFQHLTSAQVAALHQAMTVMGPPLSLVGQALTFNFDGNHFTLAGGNLQIKSQMSITTDSNGVKLNGDASSPGNSKYYGTDSGGNKGFFDLPSGGGSVLYSVVYAAGASGTWTAPAGVHVVYITGCGGGSSGGGGRYNTSPGSGSGGGAAASVKRFPYRVVPETGYSYSVGSKGEAVAAATDGNDGGNTTFGDLVLGGGKKGVTQLSGGAGGNGGAIMNIAGKGGGAPTVAGTSATTADFTAGELLPGAGGGGNDNTSGMAKSGGNSPFYNGGYSVNQYQGGGGGASLFGAGGNGVQYNTGGSATGYGAGGAGGGWTGVGQFGSGAGSDGFLLIEYWIATTP